MEFKPKQLDPLQFEINMALQGLPPEMAELAREAGAFLRSRQIKSPAELMRAVFLYCGIDQTLREVAGTLTLLGNRITDEGVRTRLKACGPWVNMMLSQMLPHRNLGNLPDGLRFLVFDASTVQAPGATGTDYRIHAGIDLVTLAITDVRVTDSHTGETLKNFKLNQGDVAIVDRGYCHANAILEKQNEGADVIVRYSHTTMPLYHDDGTNLNLMEVLKLKSNKRKSCICISVQAGAEKEEKVCGWIHAIAMPEAQADAARSRCHAEARRRGSTPSVEALFLAGYIIVFATLSPHILSTQMILEIYRCRRQIELVFKRWKSLPDADKLRAKRGGKLAELWLNGKLLYALMLEKRMRGLTKCKWGYLDGNRDGTWWRLLKLLRYEVDPIITGVQFWREENWADAIKMMLERPRKRKLQKLPERVIKLLQSGPDLSVPAL